MDTKERVLAKIAEGSVRDRDIIRDAAKYGLTPSKASVLIWEMLDCREIEMNRDHTLVVPDTKQ